MKDYKQALRARLLSERTAMTADDVRMKSRLVQERILSMEQWQKAEEVLLYAPIKNEVRTDLLMDNAFAAGKRVLLPRCRAGCPGIMDVAAASCPDDLHPGAYGIPEPNPETCPIPEVIHPEIIVVPAVGYDTKGFRLGFGGGYYDRFLADHADSATTIGPAYEFQVLTEPLPRMNWDMPVRIIVTEERILWI